MQNYGPSFLPVGCLRPSLFSGTAVVNSVELIEQRDKQENIVYFEKQSDCEIRQAWDKENKLNMA